MLTGRRILITGAAGSIGSEMARQVATFKPAELVLVDQADVLAVFLHDLVQHMGGLLAIVAGEVRKGMDHCWFHYKQIAYGRYFRCSQT